MTENLVWDDATAERKIAKMRERAEHARTTPEEREALQSRIAELMAKYSISKARIDAARLKAGSATGEKIVTKRVKFTGIYAKGYVLMAHQAVSALGNLKTLQYVNNNKGSDVDLAIIGFESDVEQASLLATSLQLQAATAMDQWWTEKMRNLPLTAMEKFKERREFIIRFGSGAASRITEARRRTIHDEETREPGTEIMLADRGALVDKRFAEMFPRTRRSSGRRDAGYGAGSSAGYAAGRRANTGDTQVGGSSQRSIR